MEVVNAELVKVVEKYADDWKIADNEVNRLIAENVFPAYFKTALRAAVQHAAMHALYMKAQTMLSLEDLEALGVTEDFGKTHDAGFLIYKAFMNGVTRSVINEIKR